MFCKCNQDKKSYPLRTWYITHYCYTPKGYSRIRCSRCGCEWLARAAYQKRVINKDPQLRIEEYESEINKQQWRTDK